MPARSTAVTRSTARSSAGTTSTVTAPDGASGCTTSVGVEPSMLYRYATTSASPPPANVTATGRPTLADVPFGKLSTGNCGLAIAPISASPTTRSQTRTSSTAPAHQSVGEPAHRPRPTIRFPVELNVPAGTATVAASAPLT